jgi:hypothetical protein
MNIILRTSEISAAHLTTLDVSGTPALEIYLKSGQEITVLSEPEKLLEAISAAMTADPMSLDYSETISATTLATNTVAK